MRRLTVLAILIAAACAPAPLELPAEPATRAATCTAVRALELRSNRTGNGQLSFAGFTETLHFAMLYAAEDAVQVDLRRLLAVTQRAPAIMEELEGANWASLIEPCNAAYPETQKSAGSLPNDAYEAGLTCFGLAEFLVRTAGDYPEQRREIAGIGDRALQAAQPILRQRARDDEQATRIAGGYAARGFKAGRPDTLLAQCRRRFPPAV